MDWIHSCIQIQRESIHEIIEGLEKNGEAGKIMVFNEWLIIQCYITYNAILYIYTYGLEPVYVFEKKKNSGHGPTM